MFQKSCKLTVIFFVLVVFFSQSVSAKTDSCTECNVLMDGQCLAKKYLPFNQFDPGPESIREWSASEGNFFTKDNIIGVRFRLDDESIKTLSLGGFGMEIEVVEKNGSQLKWKKAINTMPESARVIADTKAFDELKQDTVNALLVRNPEKLKAWVDYYAWFYFDSIPESGVTIQPNLVIDINSDCYGWNSLCYDVSDSEICKYFPMETDSYAQFTAYPDGRNGVKWIDKEKSEPYTPNITKVNDRWYVAKPANPPDPEDSENGDDYNNLPGSTISSNPSGSRKKPDLFVKELAFRDGKTKYYDDEKIHVDAYVKNVGSDVSKKTKKISVKLYRFKGEKENGDTKEIGDENIKGENLGSGKTKHEEFSFSAPDNGNKYQLYAVADAKNSVSESDESNNRSGNLAFRVHKRPDIKTISLIMDNGRTEFEPWEIPSAKVTFTNTGGEPFKDVPVSWYLDGVHFADDNMRHWNIEHDEEKHEEVNITQVLTPGNHTLKVCAESEDDKDNSDNCRELIFSVSQPDPDPIVNYSCQYFDVIKIFHGNLADIRIVFNDSLKQIIRVVGQTNPDNYWDELPILNGELSFNNWPNSSSPEFSAYYLDNQNNRQWLDASICPEHFKWNPDPNDQHFIIRADMEGEVADAN